VIVWINGASGSGKTQVAHELRRRLGRGWIADPERVGFALRRMMPPSRRDTFQQLPAWRRAVVDILGEIDAGRDGIVIVPQALLDPDHHTEIVERLRVDGHQVHHFTLTAAPEMLAHRLRRRGEGRRSWAYAEIDRCVVALRDPRFADHIPTDEQSIDEIVEEIAARTGLSVGGRQPAGRRHVTRWAVQLRHIRLPQ
jgi:predicted kinase